MSASNWRFNVRDGITPGDRNERTSSLFRHALLAVGFLFFLAMIVLNLAAVVRPSLPFTVVYAFNCGWMVERIFGG